VTPASEILLSPRKSVTYLKFSRTPNDYAISVQSVLSILLHPKSNVIEVNVIIFGIATINSLTPFSPHDLSSTVKWFKYWILAIDFPS